MISELLAGRFGIPNWQYTLSASSANTETLRLARMAIARAALQDVLTREAYQRVNALGAQLADGIERAASAHV